jgi:hypothetical protein
LGAAVIDLGDELADYGENPQKPKPPEGMSSYGSLAGLQAKGFSYNPQYTFTRPSKFTVGPPEPLVNSRWLTRVAGGLMPPWVMPSDTQDGFESTGSISEDDA